MDLYLKTQKEKITEFLDEYLKDQKENFSNVNKWSEDVFPRVLEFVKNGKMIRGSLVIFFYNLFKEDLPEDIVKTAAAIEIMHSSLLIHDDIMDNDRTRRHLPSMHAAYQKNNSEEFGKNMAICIGDLGFFLGVNLLNTITSSKREKIIDFITKEIAAVCLGQMEDLSFGLQNENPSEDEILNLYKWKTGRYTFSLPMTTASILAGANEKDIKLLEKIGEDLGIIFQLQDDELSLFGETNLTGKGNLSDIKENKKTLFRIYLFEKANTKDKERLKTLFGNSEISQDDADYIKDLIKSLSIDEKIKKIKEKLFENAKDKVSSLGLEIAKKEMLLDLLNSFVEREK